MEDDIKRLQFLTRNYELLQGYPIALAGLLYIVAGISVMIWGHPAVYLIYGWLSIPGLALLCCAGWLVCRYHRRKFGIAKPPTGLHRGLWLAAFVVLYVIIALLVGPDFKNLKVALEPTVLNAGVILILAGLLPTFPWRHYAAIGMLLVVVGFFPALSIATVEQLWHGWSFMAVGVALLLCGMIDRMIFMHHLPPTQAEESHA